MTSPRYSVAHDSNLYSKKTDGHVLPGGNNITIIITVCFQFLHPFPCLAESQEIQNTSWFFASCHCVTCISYLLKLNFMKGIH